MSHGANTAFSELSALGTCTCGSVMPPCPWFPEAIEMAKANPRLDLGVHLTLTSEKTPYRWRPLTSPPASAGLTDPGLLLARRSQRASRQPQGRRSGAARADRSNASHPARRHASRRVHGNRHVPRVCGQLR
jgi:predicted glycoside hydrolase/deacetylase ChbG (UPF0249 family)